MSDRLLPGQSLHVNESLLSADGSYQLILQSDGNLVVYPILRSGDQGKATWASKTMGKGTTEAIMQTDGNFVLLEGTQPITSPRTEGHPGSYIVMQSDGNLVIYHPTPIWSTRNHGDGF